MGIGALLHCWSQEIKQERSYSYRVEDHNLGEEKEFLIDPSSQMEACVGFLFVDSLCFSLSPRKVGLCREVYLHVSWQPEIRVPPDLNGAPWVTNKDSWIIFGASMGEILNGVLSPTSWSSRSVEDHGVCLLECICQDCYDMVSVGRHKNLMGCFGHTLENFLDLTSVNILVPRSHASFEEGDVIAPSLFRGTTFSIKGFKLPRLVLGDVMVGWTFWSSSRLAMVDILKALWIFDFRGKKNRENINSRRRHHWSYRLIKT